MFAIVCGWCYGLTGTRTLAKSVMRLPVAERRAVMSAVAKAVIRYRAERGLSQTALGRLLGWSQPVVARLEAAEHNPSMDTLLALSRGLGMRVHVDVGPKTGLVAKVNKSRAA